MNELKNKLFGTIFGLVVGDAFGVPLEFSDREILKKNPVTEMKGFGVHNQPPGTWSDDTSLTLCLIDSLCNGYDLQDIAKKFVKWYEEGLWTPHGYAFDIGTTTYDAIQAMRMGVSPLSSGGNDEYSNGNGSLMRISPLIFFTVNMSQDERMKIVHEVSAITHAHPRSLIACGFYVNYGIELLNGNSKDEAYYKTSEVIKEYYSKDSTFYRELEHYNRILDGEIWKLPENEIHSHGYVVHSLEAALWSFINSENFRDAVIKAVNLGHDTDTIGAITGSLAGLYYGYFSIPNEWLEKIAKKEEIKTLLNRFYLSLFSSHKLV